MDNILANPVFAKLAQNNALTVAEFCAAVALLVRTNISFNMVFKPSTGRTQPIMRLTIFFSNTRQTGYQVQLFHP